MNRQWLRLMVGLSCLGLFLACSTTPSGEKEVVSDAGNPEQTNDTFVEKTTKPIAFVAMTFNIGTTLGLQHDKGDDGYTSEHARIADELYENSLSWNPAEKALTQYLAQKKVDLVGFQEMFYDPWCEQIKVDPKLDFVCKEYTPTRPLQIQRLLGPDFHVACAQGQDDNCVGIRKSVGRFLGCPVDKPCLGGVKGQGPPDKCSRGARVGYIEVELTDGLKFTLILVHGTSGFKAKDQLCRKAQFHQIFVDRGDGTPAASGKVNLILGDINTDPFLAAGDPSAEHWNKFVGKGKPFSYVSSSDPDGPKTYGGLLRIDHIVSDKFTGTCVVPGVSSGEPDILDTVYWDHKPVICKLALP